MKIAILGTRGIPNYYGGFEQFAQYLSEGLVGLGHEVSVYNSHNHPYQEDTWNGVDIIHCFDPEDKLGTAGQFVYDLNCILDSRKRNFDVILQLGYTSSSVWNWLFSKSAVIVTNMDGLEWKRSKYSKPVQTFLKIAEKLAVQFSDFLIADSEGIKGYLVSKYKKESVYIPYGADLFAEKQAKVLSEYGLLPYQYDMLIARLEPENSIEEILDGFVASDVKRQFLVIGNTNTKFGKYISSKITDKRVLFVGYVNGIEKLDSLRHFSNLYFHGHTVGGTNPSLLEAMASSALICANDNIFNKAILGEDAFYFSNVSDVSVLLQNSLKTEEHIFVSNNLQKIKNRYSWKSIIFEYEQFFKTCLNK